MSATTRPRGNGALTIVPRSLTATAVGSYIAPSTVEENDERIYDVLTATSIDDPTLSARDIIVVGFPHDTGVRRNFGRLGAAHAPKIIRKHLGRLTTPFGDGHEALRCRFVDIGNIRCSGRTATDQHRLGMVVGRILTSGAFPIIIGGGHETAFGHFLGYVRAQRNVSVINVDAHYDVRRAPSGEGHSGSSFRQIIEHKAECVGRKQYMCVGVQRHANSRGAGAFMRSHGAKYIELADVDMPRARRAITRFVAQASRTKGGLLLSVDMDVVRQSDAPGVSAPSPIGMSAEQLLDCVCRIVRSGATSIDVCELNPQFDRDEQTARLASLLIRQVIVERLETLRRASASFLAKRRPTVCA